MRRSHFILIFTGLILFTTIIWLIRFEKEAPRETVTKKKPENTPPQEQSSTSLTSVVSRPLDVTEKQWEYLLKRHQAGIAANGPIVFYARAIDQFKRPVGGVLLKVRISSYDVSALSHIADMLKGKGGSDTRDEVVELHSNNDGMFSLTGKLGMWLRVEGLEKDGYIWSDPGLTMFSFQPSQSSAKQPSTSRASPLDLHLWKKEMTTATIVCAQRISLHQTNHTYQINLFNTGKVNTESTERAAADLIVALEYPYPADADRRYHQRLNIEVLEGGILLSKDNYLFKAPDDGYSPAITFDFTPDDISNNNWEKKCYARVRRGKIFAAITFSLSLIPKALEIRVVINPIGTTFLEIDPAKEIRDSEMIQRLDRETRP